MNNEYFTVMYAGKCQTIRCTFPCACTVAHTLEGTFMDEQGKTYDPEAWPEYHDHNLGIAVAANLMLKDILDMQRSDF